MTGSKLPSQILDAAADLIEPEGRWTQGAFARTAKGRPIGLRDGAAACWCAVGAIERVVGGAIFTADRAFAFAQRSLQSAWAPFNDAPNRTQAEVVAALRKAADLARSEGQ